MTICENATNPNISNKIIHASFKTGELSLHDDFESFKLFSEKDCLRFNGFRKDLQNFNFAKLLNTDMKEMGFEIEFESNKTDNSFLVVIKDNYLKTLMDVIIMEKNTRNLIRITKSVDKKLSEPYNACQEFTDKTYRHNNCVEECWTDKTASKYNCSFGYYRSRDNFCDYSTLLKSHSEVIVDCKKNCLKECESTRFDYSVSTRSTQTTSLRIRFSDFSYREISQVPKLNFFSLTSSIGGALGLFIGLKFLSFIEFVEFLIEIFYIMVAN